MLGWGCGGGDEASSADAPAPAPAAAEQAGGDQASADSAELDSIQRANEMLLSRETFSYGGGSRDPFSSLLNLASAGPQFQDLELVGVYLDPDRPGNSVALLRERNTGRPYNLRVGDQLGRARLAQIRRTDIVFTIEDFGFERQETLALPKREEGTP
jgi:hypothetical protein